MSSPLPLDPAARVAPWLTLAAAALLAACSTTAPPGKAPPRGSGPSTGQSPAGPAPRPLPVNPDRDGPEANPPPDLHRTPDAEPVVEPLRRGGPNKPYEIDGQGYVPMTADEPVLERGLASWYGRKFHGRRTASGEVYNMYAMTAAHPTLPIPSYARVRNPANDRAVVVRINDRGPFKAGRIIDLSYTAALKLDLLGGVAPVEVERLTHEAIRTGSWRRPVEARAGGDATGPVFDAPGGLVAEGDGGAQLSAVRLDEAAGSALSATALSPLAAPSTSSASRPTPDTPPAWDTQPSANPPPVVTSLQPEPAAKSAGAPTRPAVEAAIPGTGAGPAVAGATASKADVAAPRPSPGNTTEPPTARATAPEELPRERAGTRAARGWWLQLGAYRSPEGAAQHQRQLSGAVGWLAPLLTLFREDALNKVQAGPFPSRAEAQAASQRLRSQLPLVPMLVERR